MGNKEVESYTIRQYVFSHLGFSLMNNRDMKTTMRKVNTLGTCLMCRYYPRVELGGHILNIVNYKLSPPLTQISHSLIFQSYKAISQTFVSATFSCPYISSRAFVVALENVSMLLICVGQTPYTQYRILTVSFICLCFLLIHKRRCAKI